MRNQEWGFSWPPAINVSRGWVSGLCLGSAGSCDVSRDKDMFYSQWSASLLFTNPWNRDLIWATWTLLNGVIMCWFQTAPKEKRRVPIGHIHLTKSNKTHWFDDDRRRHSTLHYLRGQSVHSNIKYALHLVMAKIIDITSLLHPKLKD